MKWLIVLNAALAGIVVFVVGVFGHSLLRRAMRPTPAASAVAVEKTESRRPLEVLPVCIFGHDFRTGKFIMKVSNVSDKPLSYEGRSSSELGPYMEFYMNGDWVPWWTNSCNSGGIDSKTFVIQPGDAVTFRESTSGMATSHSFLPDFFHAGRSGIGDPSRRILAVVFRTKADSSCLPFHCDEGSTTHSVPTPSGGLDWSLLVRLKAGLHTTAADLVR